MKFNKSYKIGIALVTAIAIILSVLLASPVKAFSINFNNPASGQSGSPYIFQVTISTVNGEAVSFQSIGMKIYNTTNQTNYSDTYFNLPLTTAVATLFTGTSSSANIQATASSNFNTGAYSIGITTMAYNVTWNAPTGWVAGTYQADLIITASGTTTTNSAVFTLLSNVTTTTTTTTTTTPSTTIIPTTTVGTGIATWVPTSIGATPAEIIVSSADTKCALDIQKGTLVTNAQGNPVNSITCNPPTSTPPPAPTGTIVAAYDMGPAGATFSPPLTITIKYDPATLGGTPESELVFSFYNTATNNWVPLTNIVIDLVNHTIRAQVSHFTLFAILASSTTTTTPVITTTSTSTNTTTTSTSTSTNTNTGTLTTSTSTSTSTTKPTSTTSVTSTSSSTPTSTSTTTTITTTTQPTTSTSTSIPTTTTTTTPPAKSGTNWALIGGIIGAIIVIGLLVFFFTRRLRKD